MVLTSGFAFAFPRAYLKLIFFIEYMQAETLFTVVSKQTDNKDGRPVALNHEVYFRLQKEGSPSIKHSGIIGSNQLNPALESIILQMHQSDNWTLSDNHSNKFSLQVIAIGNQTDSRDPRQRAEDLKAEGNGLIKAKKHAEATQRYHSAYELVLNDIEPTSKELKLSIASNLALAHLNSGSFATAIQWCDIHLQESLQPSIKIIYRKASAKKALKQWESAREDIKLGIELSKEDQESLKNFQQLLATLEREQKEQKLKEKAFYGKMLG